MDIKHTIIIITYNHEKTISKAIDSVVKNKTLPYELLIFDDFSQDKTSEIVRKYEALYSFITYIDNNENIGMYENLNKIFDAEIKGDIVSFLSGDDWIEGDMLNSFNVIVKEKKLNGRNQSFLITPNTKLLDYNYKKEKILDNYVLRKKNQFKLKVKLKTYGRYSGISQKLYKKMEKNNLNFGIWADQLQAVDMYKKCDNFYFVNRVHNIYYRNERSISVTTSTKEISQSAINVFYEILDLYKDDLHIFDEIYVKKIIYSNKLNINKNIKNILLFIIFNFISFGQDDLVTWIKSFLIILPVKLKKIIKRRG